MTETAPVAMGACPDCGAGVGTYDDGCEIVTCGRCATPWPESYWTEQVEDGGG